jgi:hypothetical protein
MPVIAFLLMIAGSFLAGTAWAADPAIIFADQGPDWTTATRADFYGQDQGSRMIPLAWLQALKQESGQPFLADNLSRYGYLPNPSNRNGLPVGFSASGPAGSEIVGMTCSACHTRQITAEDKTYRIDGGPAIVDFQTFLADLDTTVGKVVASDAAFAPFAATVLAAAAPNAGDVAALRRDVNGWYLRYHTIVKRGLPTTPWGPGRLDAVGMIFNRVTGLDLGPPPSFLIAENIQQADAPVRYPFLWNAAVQDKTQWPSFADNGSDVLGLARNVGEVFGVFAVFQPKREGLIVNFLNNSANFDGLGKLEDLIRKIAPPKWPWSINSDLVAQGEAIFKRPAPGGSCQDCHGIKPGTVRLPSVQTWATPPQNVGTDTREHDTIRRTAKTGVLQGAFIPFVTSPLKPNDLAFSILTTAVVGSIAERVVTGGGLSTPSALVAATPTGPSQPAPGTLRLQLNRLPPSLRDLEGAFHLPAQGQPQSRFQGAVIPKPMASVSLPPRGVYESRVLQGIWAAAPYLHNGSVRSLWELLTPAADRVKEFKVGPAYDTKNVGLAPEQTQFGSSTVTTDCSALNSGNSRCGHEFGTTLQDPEKWALIEYLKTL